jgi:hypothetical protein
MKNCYRQANMHDFRQVVMYEKWKTAMHFSAQIYVN